MAEQQYASMDADDFSQGGGLFDDVDAVVTVAEFTDQAPDNYTAEGEPKFFKLGIRIDGAEEDVTQHYPLGKKTSESFEIVADGARLAGDGKIVGSSKFGIFLSTLKGEGFPVGKLSASMKNLVGLRAHFNRIADPERKGLMTGKKEKKYPETTLCVSKIHALPGEKPAAGGKKNSTSTKPAAGAPKADAAVSDVNALAQETLLTILAENDGKIAKSKLPLAATRALGDNKQKAAVVKLIVDSAFLGGEGQPWKFENNTVSI